MSSNNQIAAIATAPGHGGIGVVRVSGAELNSFALMLTGSQPVARKALLADFIDANGSVIDRGILLFFPAPNSFTGEDVLELQGHGGPVVMHMLLHRCLELGARLAAPGEFSRRAFLNGKLDLAQAEAVADLIEATSEAAARSAVRSLAGEFSQKVRSLVETLIELRMRVEATLDFSEEDIDPIGEARLSSRLEVLRIDLATLIARARAGSVLRSGLHVVLVGKPNVGKSSLLNCLAKDEKAIVTEVPGTTRDAIRETIFLEGIPLHIIDTAGLRETSDRVEALGIQRTWKEIERADVILQLVDIQGAQPVADGLMVFKSPGKVAHIVIENKCDLVGLSVARFEQSGRVHIRASAKFGWGIELLHAELLRIAGWTGRGEDVILARARHLEALADAAFRLQCASDYLVSGVELCAEELRLAQEALGRITGAFSADDLLGEIFSRFCIGK